MSTPRPWYPAVLPPPGFRLEHDGATFEAVKSGPHPKSRYNNVFLVTWRTWCTGCGSEMSTMSTAKTWQDLRGKVCAACVRGLTDEAAGHPEMPSSEPA